MLYDSTSGQSMKKPYMERVGDRKHGRGVGGEITLNIAKERKQMKSLQLRLPHHGCSA